ncbi:MAG: BMC domain-containing protein [Chlorobi bacterium]|nr:BMC domain-containing protein [Chlorobiota bacterium]
MNIDKDTIVLAILEFDSIAAGFNALDDIVKTAPVKIIDARTICFGKFLIVFSGDVASAEYSFNKGKETGGNSVVDSLFLPLVHAEIIDAVGNIKQTENWGTIGIIETKTVTSAVEAADIAAKEGGVEIVEIRLANGFGGKSYVKMIGDLENVQAATDAGTAKITLKNLLFAKTIIPQPEKEIKKYFLK